MKLRKPAITASAPPAHSQDAFGNNYKCSQTRWQYKRNQHRLLQAMIKKFRANKNKNISLATTYVNLDCENGFPGDARPVMQGIKHLNGNLLL